jgi:hypothetical protein
MTGFAIRNGATGTPLGARVGLWKADGSDYIGGGTSIIQLNAGDKIQQLQNYVGSCWGTDGWNGNYLEIEYVGPVQ